MIALQVRVPAGFVRFISGNHVLFFTGVLSYVCIGHVRHSFSLSAFKEVFWIEAVAHQHIIRIIQRLGVFVFGQHKQVLEVPLQAVVSSPVGIGNKQYREIFLPRYLGCQKHLIPRCRLVCRAHWQVSLQQPLLVTDGAAALFISRHEMNEFLVIVVGGYIRPLPEILEGFLNFQQAQWSAFLTMKVKADELNQLEEPEQVA